MSLSEVDLGADRGGRTGGIIPYYKSIGSLFKCRYGSRKEYRIILSNSLSYKYRSAVYAGRDFLTVDCLSYSPSTVRPSSHEARNYGISVYPEALIP